MQPALRVLTPEVKPVGRHVLSRPCYREECCCIRIECLKENMNRPRSEVEEVDQYCRTQSSAGLDPVSIEAIEVRDELRVAGDRDVRRSVERVSSEREAAQAAVEQMGCDVLHRPERTRGRTAPVPIIQTP